MGAVVALAGFELAIVGSRERGAQSCGGQSGEGEELELHFERLAWVYSAD